MNFEMTLITQRDRIRAVRKRWNDQYPNAMKGHKPWINGLSSAEICGRLDELDLETCSRGDVDKAIGVDGWVDTKCDACDENKDTLVRLGEVPDYESRFIDICPECLAQALEFSK